MTNQTSDQFNSGYRTYRILHTKIHQQSQIRARAISDAANARDPNTST